MRHIRPLVGITAEMERRAKREAKLRAAERREMEEKQRTWDMTQTAIASERDNNTLRAQVKRLQDALHDAEAIGDFPSELRDRLALKEAAACVPVLVAERDEARAQVTAMVAVLRVATQKPAEMQEIMRINDLVITDLGDPMQKLAFTLYTNLVSLASSAERLLDDEALARVVESDG